MKRLFCVKQGNKTVPFSEAFLLQDSSYKATEKVYTDSKIVAKAFRDYLGGQSKGFYVSRGIDHVGVHGNRGHRRGKVS